MNIKIISIIFLLIILPYSLSAYRGACTGHEGVCRTDEECSFHGGKSIIGYCPDDPYYIKCCY